jgi:hypothetical protein
MRARSRRRPSYRHPHGIKANRKPCRKKCAPSRGCPPETSLPASRPIPFCGFETRSYKLIENAAKQKIKFVEHIIFIKMHHPFFVIQSLKQQSLLL